MPKIRKQSSLNISPTDGYTPTFCDASQKLVPGYYSRNCAFAIINVLDLPSIRVFPLP